MAETKLSLLDQAGRKLLESKERGAREGRLLAGLCA
jgi:hypothetical protein